MAIECNWKVKAGEFGNFSSFKTLYPDARLLLIATDAAKPRLNRQNGWIEAGLNHLHDAVKLASNVN